MSSTQYSEAAPESPSNQQTLTKYSVDKLKEMKCAIPSPLTFELNRYIVCNAKLKFVQKGSEDLLFQLCRRPDGTSDVRRFIPPECNPNDGGDAYKGPQTYLTFKKRFEEIRANYRALNPFVESGVAGESCKLGPDDDNGLHPSVKEFLRGGVISIWAIWEAFVKDVLTEAFDEVVRQLREKSDHERKTLAENLARLIIPRYPPPSWFMYDELLAEDREPFQTADKVDKHKQNALLTVYALLSHVNREDPRKGSCIDKMFKQLFYPKPDFYLSVSEFQLSTNIPLKDMSYEYILRNTGQKPRFLINHCDLLHDILRLYYGLRNSFCHGSNERTVKTGALSHFPSTTQAVEEQLREKATITLDQTQDTPSDDGCIEELSIEISKIYESIKVEGRTAYVDYLTLLNMNRFILRVAHLLPVAIAKMTREHFQIRLWRYDFDELGDP